MKEEKVGRYTEDDIMKEEKVGRYTEDDINERREDELERE